MVRVGKFSNFTALSLALCVVGLSQFSFAQESTDKKVNGRVMIVLDASGSMLQQIGGKQKIDIARDALGNILSGWDENIEVGLMAYGHRKKGDCEDIEVLVPVGKVDQGKLLSAAKNLTPLGKTPLSSATVQAAEALKFSEETASVILISDGEETCDNDPCAVGTELESRGVNFTAHVIGFDIQKAEHTAQLKCLAENTGGKYVSAKDSAELQSALKTVVEEVKAEEPEEKKEEVKASQSAGLKLAATEVEGGDEIASDVRWEVFSARDEDGNPKDSVETSYEAIWTPKELKTGKYILACQHGNVKVLTDWDTETSPRLALNLNVGSFTPKAVFEGSDKALEGSWKFAKSSNPKDETTDYNETPNLKLEAGTYLFRFLLGDAETTGSVEVKAGESLSKTFTVKAGTLKPSLLYSAEGDEVEDGISWKIVSADGDSSEEEAVSSSYTTKPEFILPVGDYIVTAKVGAATFRSDVVKIESNKVERPVFNLNAGVVEIARASEEGAFEILDAKKNIKGERKSRSHSYNKKFMQTLNPGKYVATLKIEGKVEEKEFEITAGERTEVTFE